MIVQCEHCKTKYRIADDKVKGKGVKVRCAKCEHVFTVTLPEKDLQVSPAESAPLGSGSIGPSPEPPSEEKSVFGEDRGPEPAAPQPQEETEFTGSEDPSPPPSFTTPEGSEDLSISDTTFEGPGDPPISDTTSEDSGDLSISEEGTQQFESTSSPEPASGSYLPPSPEEASWSLGSPRPEHEMDQAGPGETAAPIGSTPVSEETGFEIEGTMREETPPEPDQDTSKPMEDQSKTDQPPDREWGNISIDAPPAADPAEEGFGLADGPGYEPPPLPMEESLDQELPDAVSGPSRETTTAFTSRQIPAKSGGGKKGLLFLLLLAVLGGGGYFAYPKIMDIVQSRGQPPAGTLTPAKVQVKALSRSDGKIIYSVRGEVRNESGSSVGMIKVEAQFRNAEGEVLSKAASYCGNLFEDSELVRADLVKVKKDLQNELGQSLSNSNIAPGKSVPFLVILENPPSGVNRVTVTISSFKETT